MATLSVDTDITTPAPDCAGLAGTLLRPAGPGSHPAVVMRTPYDRTTFASAALQVHGLALAEAGYAVLLQDVRGRFGSSGAFTPFVNEQTDGVATIEWVAEQSWCNGRVGSAGLSYNGFAQVAAATTAPEPLQAWVPALTPCDVRTSWIRRGGLLDLGFHLAWGLGNIAALDPRTADPAPLMAAFSDPSRVATRHPADQPELAAVPGGRWYFDWLQGDDPYPADARVPGASALAKVTAPALVIGGWFDVFSTGSSDLASALREKNPAGGHRFAAGPWDHSGLPFKRRAGDRDFGAAALIDLHKLQLAWFDQHLRDGEVVESDRTFVTGRNAWRTDATWPPPTRRLDLELGSTDMALHARAPGSPQVRVDPADPTPAPGGALFPWEPLLRSGAYDQAVRQQRPDVVVFVGPPLDEAVLVAGQPTLRLMVESDEAGLPVYVTLSESMPGEPVWNVADGMALAQTGETTSCELGPINHEFAAGSRIVVDVAFAGYGRVVHPRRPHTVRLLLGEARSVLSLPVAV